MRLQPIYTQDAFQQVLGFMVRQGAFIERTVAKIRYPEFQYSQLIPVDTSADEWTKSITYFSLDQSGAADWFEANSTDMRLADVVRAQHESTVSMAGIGYRYNYAELAEAMRMGINLTAEKAASAKRGYEQMVDSVAIVGDTAKNMAGLINYPGITTVAAAYVGAGGGGTSPEWNDKTPAQIIADINTLLSGIYLGSNTVEMADTLLLPHEVFQLLSEMQMTGIQSTVMEWIKRTNVYTTQTGQQLMIRAVRQLSTAGAGGSGRVIAYRRDPDVLKMHIPMTHRFLPVWQTGPLIYDVPGIFRLGGLEIRRPYSVRYMDYVIAPGYE